MRLRLPVSELVGGLLPRRPARAGVGRLGSDTDVDSAILDV